VRIPRSYAIASTEVTVAEFQRFLDANPEARAHFAYEGYPDRMADVMKTFSPDANDFQVAVTRYEAAMYCNWLSQREGLPQSEWVYPVAGIGDGMVLPANYLSRRGYRSPTEAEWEYAARAGTTTPRFYGISAALLDQYAWYSKYPPKRKNDPVDPNDPPHAWPVAELKPNDFGLFDIYGNVGEWCHDRLRDLSGISEDREDDVLQVTDTVSRFATRRWFPV
jgi:formylglycine-generating enzyme required for sulfatase activity